MGSVNDSWRLECLQFAARQDPHAWTHQGAHNAATAGVASIEHGFAMTDEDLEIAKKNKVVLGIEAGIPPKVLLQVRSCRSNPTLRQSSLA